MSDSGVGVSEISMLILSRCCIKLRAQQFGVSDVGRCSGPTLESAPERLLVSLWCY